MQMWKLHLCKATTNLKFGLQKGETTYEGCPEVCSTDNIGIEFQRKNSIFVQAFLGL